MAHALLSPSASARWLNCPGGLLPSLEMPDQGSPYADEGTKAHAWLEKMFKGDVCQDLLLEDAEMYEYVREAYVYIVMALEGQVPNAEQKTEIFSIRHSGGTEECFGTVDAYGVVEKELHVFDFKYGKGVRVDAKENPQMKLYAFGILRNMTNIDNVVVHIVQPRLNWFNEYNYSPKVLKQWIDEFVKPTALLAVTGKGATVKGEHCRFCKLVGRCKTTSFINELENTYSSLSTYEELCTDEKILAVTKAKDMTNWFKAVEEALLNDVIDKRVIDPRLRLVEVKGRTKITDEAKAIEILKAAGVQNYAKNKLLPLGMLKKYADILAPVIEVPVSTKLEIVEGGNER